MGLEDARLLVRIDGQRFVGDRGDRAQVAERRVLVFVGRSDLGRRLDRSSLDQAIELRSQASRLRIFGRRRGDVAALEIDQLLTLAANVEMIGVRDRELRGPPESEVLGQRLRVNRPVRHLAGVTFQNRAQRSAPEVGRNRRANQVEDGRQNVDVLHRHGHTAAGPFAIRLLDQQRHAQRRIVQRGAGVGRPAVGGEDDCRLVVEAELLELAHELGHRRLRAALVDLDEQEESPAAPRAHPAGGRIGGFGAVAFDSRHRRVSLIRQLRVEERKSLRHARFGAQQERRYGRAGFEPAALQQLRHRLRVFFQREASLVAHAMLERQLPGQDRGMRGKRQRRVRVGALEDDGVGRERIDRGSRRRSSRRVGAAGDRRPRRAKPVDRNEHNRSANRRRFARIPPARQRGPRHGHDDQRGDKGSSPSARGCGRWAWTSSISILLHGGLGAAVGHFVLIHAAVGLPDGLREAVGVHRRRRDANAQAKPVRQRPGDALPFKCHL